MLRGGADLGGENENFFVEHLKFEMPFIHPNGVDQETTGRKSLKLRGKIKTKDIIWESSAYR